MKKNISLLSILFAIFLSGFYSFATTNPEQSNSYLETDKAGIEAQMRALDDLETTVLARPGVSYQVLKAENNANITLAKVSPESNASLMLSASKGGAPLGIPSIIWGFCFGVFGLLFVYLFTEDNKETKMAFIGCLIGTLIWGLGGLFLNWY